MKIYRFIILSIVIALLSGCSSTVSAPQATSTPQATPTNDVEEELGNIAMEWAAASTEDPDEMVALVSDDIVFHNAPPNGATLTGIKAAWLWAKGNINANVSVETEVVGVEGNTVTMSTRLTVNGNFMGTGEDVIVIEDGKITSVTFGNAVK